jgi:hypothetical protein
MWNWGTRMSRWIPTWVGKESTRITWKEIDRQRKSSCWETWSWGGALEPSRSFRCKVRRGTPLQQVMGKLIQEYFQERTSRIKRVIRIMCPQCYKKGAWYTVWQLQDYSGNVIYEVHLYKGIRGLDGKIIEWEMV